MEPIAAKRCLMDLKNDGKRPSMFVTKRSTAIRSMIAALNKELGGIPIQYEFDITKFYDQNTRNKIPP